MNTRKFVTLFLAVWLLAAGSAAAQAGDGHLVWRQLPELPDGAGNTQPPTNLGMADPFVGVHQDALLVAGGANFPIPDGGGLWDKATFKHYCDQIWVLTRHDRNGDGEFSDDEYTWHTTDTTLPSPRAYGACASTDRGVVCVGGMSQTFDAEGNQVAAEAHKDAFLLRWDKKKQQVTRVELPPLPVASVNGGAAAIGQTVYVFAGQTGVDLDSAMQEVYALDLSRLSAAGKGSPAREHEEDNGGRDGPVWRKVLSLPGGPRAYAAVVAQHNGYNHCLYVIGGRRTANDDDPDPVHASLDGRSAWHLYRDVWEFCPARYTPDAHDANSGVYAGKGRLAAPWRRRADIQLRGQPTPRCAGTAVAIGPSHILLLSGATGEIVRDAFGQRKVDWADYPDHPGFSREVLSYHTVTDTWIDAGQAPLMADPIDGEDHQVSANAVTTPAIKWGGDIILANGEVRPKVRSPKIWAVTLKPHERRFTSLDFVVLAVYLLAMVGVGFYFARKNKSTDDYFRGGQRIPWWAAACSIYATMLSSLTYTGLPAKVFAQDWVLLVGNGMILATVPVAVYLALPFFRQIDATSAYEYLDKRFNLPVRLFGSAMFILFHISRMGIIMALTALALSAAVPMTPVQCVLLMGVLCLIYCSLGGVEAVIWTDTIQTFVLLGGAVLCLAFIIHGSGGPGAFIQTGMADQKFTAVIWDFSPTSYTILAIWVIVIGGMGQNISSYMADQAVVQRYMTTPDRKLAARSIWASGLMAVPTSALFFAIGTGLYVFYKMHPAELDPTIKTDQIFPLFIVNNLPIGVAGLIVAGIFAAAQSTVSTSMNSTATAVVTDFLRPFRACKSEKGYLNAARLFTLILGTLGTLAGLLFVSPDVRLLLDVYFKVIGMFMGLLAGLFVLGVLTRRATGFGATAGLCASFALSLVVWQFTKTEGYLYAAISIAGCLSVGYLASLVGPVQTKPLDGLTIHTTRKDREAGLV